MITQVLCLGSLEARAYAERRKAEAERKRDQEKSGLFKVKEEARKKALAEKKEKEKEEQEAKAGIKSIISPLKIPSQDKMVRATSAAASSTPIKVLPMVGKKAGTPKKQQRLLSTRAKAIQQSPGSHFVEVDKVQRTQF